MILETEVNYTVQSDSDVKILVAIDLGLVAKRNYVLPTSPQKDTIVFEYDYQNQTRYELNIFFSGESSDQKMLTLHHICAYYKSEGYKYLYLGDAAEYKQSLDGFEICGPI